MKIESAVATYAQNSSVTRNNSEVPIAGSSSSLVSTITNEATPIQSASVTLSGKAIMLSRLFGTQDANAQSPVVLASGGLTRDKLAMTPQSFLTENDRTLVSDMYAYAQQQGSDLQYVDTVAFTLGRYRQFDNGQLLVGFNGGTQFDSGGHQLTSSYSATDTATANRILNGDAITSTRLDHGFLNYILNPSNSLSNAANMGFLEQMVTKFSDKGTEAMSLDPKFANYSGYDSAVNNVVITASKEVVHEPFETQIANIDGQWYVLDPSILENSGLSSTQLANAKLNEGIVASALLGANQTTSEDSVLSKLLDLLSKNKDANMH